MTDSNVIPFPGAMIPATAPELLSALRVELREALDARMVPIKLLVHGDCLPALVATSREAGVFEDGSPSEILGMPIMLGNALVSVEEGARIVCEGDETHVVLLARRAAALSA